MIALLSRRDWVYALSLLVPLFAYNLALKAYDVAASRPDAPGLAPGLMLPDVFFNLGYSLLFLGLFAAARERPVLRRTVVSLFHGATMLVVVVTTGAHRYYVETGAALDYGTVAGWLPRLDEFARIVPREIPTSTWALLLAALLYVALGPHLVTRAMERLAGRGRPGRRYLPATDRVPAFLGPLALLLLASFFGFFSLLGSSGAAGAYTPLAKDRFANVVLTAVKEATVAEEGAATGAREKTEEETEEADAKEAETAEKGDGGTEGVPTVGHPAAEAVLAPTERTEKRNVVLIHLESARAQSVTPYNEGLNTTPYLDELAVGSLLAERAHVIVPRSSKGSTAINCGIEPALFSGPEYEQGALPAPCLADLLKAQGYRTAFFQSLSNADNSYWDDDLARNLGYEEFYPTETMDTKGFKRTNTFGLEDDVMLGPSEAWLRENGDEPFLAEYFTGTGHYGYECEGLSTGFQNFAQDEEYNRYLNCLRYLDSFVGKLVDQYKRLGLYEETIFVFYGDHGEGFREHGRYMHGDNIYEEGLWVPLMIHAPGFFEGGERVEGPSSQVDILPTVLEMLGFEATGEYPGHSLLRPLPEDRTVVSSCVSPYRCMASIRGSEKYIHHYGDQPDELYDLARDPLEKNNLADELSEEELERRREDLFAWRENVDAQYGPPDPAASASYTDPVTGEKIPS